MLAAGEDRAHGGNDGYDDQPDAHYSWDNTVPNHGRVRIGDRIVLWDKYAVIGASVVEDIATAPGEKILRSCRTCGMASLKARKIARPVWRCHNQKCLAEDDTTDSRLVQVKMFRSRHDAGWVALDGCVDGPALRLMCESALDQHSIRPFRWEPFAEAVIAQGRAVPLRRLFRREAQASAQPGAMGASKSTTASGHRNATVRVRIGQSAFRKKLLGRYGAVCVLTGAAPPNVLEAGHLYSFAAVGEHHEHGGWLFRRDLHRLFDDGDIAINPTTGLIDIRVHLLGFHAYADLDGQSHGVAPTAAQRRWLKAHWDEHRPTV